MLQKIWIGVVLAICACLRAGAAAASDSTIDAAARAMGVAALKSVQYSGTGSTFGFAQAGRPGGPWPRFNATSYSVAINYEAVRCARRSRVLRANTRRVGERDNRWLVSNYRSMS